MAAIHWKSNSSGNWNQQGDWSPQTIPGASDDATIAVNGVTVTITANAAANSLTLDSGSDLQINNGTTFAVAGGQIQDGADIQLNDGATLVMGKDGNSENFTNDGRVLLDGAQHTTTVEIAGSVTLAACAVEMGGNENVIEGDGNGSSILTLGLSAITGGGVIKNLALVNDNAIWALNGGEISLLTQ
jgi:hypothetical protein